ncbi:MAG TPA: glucose-6-phosphate dehydrogenase assembly protein OpcA [Micromonospora sp.]
MISLWDTTGAEVVQALAAERRSAGGAASGIALTVIAITDEKRVREVEAAATVAAATHPCRLLVVVRSDIDRPDRLDAEVVVGGRLGPCEAVVMRMSGQLALHAESVVLPLLAPDVPVVTWWHGEPPEEIATDFLGVVADRRITDCAQAPDPIAALRQRAVDYAPGDTDLAWTRITPWRTLVASAFDTNTAQITDATVVAPRTDPTAALMHSWLTARLGITPHWEETTEVPWMRAVKVRCANGDEVTLTRENGSATFTRSGQQERHLPLIRRSLGEELAEELRRLDADQIYAEALSALSGISGLQSRPSRRVPVRSGATALRAGAVGSTA